MSKITERAISEREFQGSIIALAELMGWLTYHVFDSRRSQAGFPDLVLLRDRVIYAEVKSSAGKLTVDQVMWLTLLRDAGVDSWAWWPEDWVLIEKILRWD